MFSLGALCRSRAYIGYARNKASRSIVVCSCASSENIAGDTHLASQNNYGKLEQSWMGSWPDSPSAQRESGSETRERAHRDSETVAKQLRGGTLESTENKGQS